jgi:hypothetical protein
MLKKKLIAPVCVIAFTVCGAVSAFAYTLTGTGYVITNETVSVIVPSTLDFALDPLEINGRGTVFSEEYPLVNKGATDVILTFTDIRVILGDDTDIVTSDEPISPDEVGGPRKVYLTLDFGNPDVEPIVLTAPAYAPPPEIVLKADFKEGAEYSLGITGSISSYPDNDWRTGDVSIALTYQLNSAAPEEAALRAEPAETPEPAPPEEEEAIATETPAQPEEPAPAETPAQPEEPAPAETPVQPEEPAQAAEPAQSGEPALTDEQAGTAEDAAPADPPGTEGVNPILNEEDDAEDVSGE